MSKTGIVGESIVHCFVASQLLEDQLRLSANLARVRKESLSVIWVETLAFPAGAPLI